MLYYLAILSCIWALTLANNLAFEGSLYSNSPNIIKFSFNQLKNNDAFTLNVSNDQGNISKIIPLSACKNGEGEDLLVLSDKYAHIKKNTDKYDFTCKMNVVFLDPLTISSFIVGETTTKLKSPLTVSQGTVQVYPYDVKTDKKLQHAPINLATHLFLSLADSSSKSSPSTISLSFDFPSTNELVLTDHFVYSYINSKLVVVGLAVKRENIIILDIHSTFTGLYLPVKFLRSFPAFRFSISLHKHNSMILSTPIHPLVPLLLSLSERSTVAPGESVSLELTLKTKDQNRRYIVGNVSYTIHLDNIRGVGLEEIENLSCVDINEKTVAYVNIRHVTHSRDQHLEPVSSSLSVTYLAQPTPILESICTFSVQVMSASPTHTLSNQIIRSLPSPSDISTPSSITLSPVNIKLDLGMDSNDDDEDDDTTPTNDVKFSFSPLIAGQLEVLSITIPPNYNPTKNSKIPGRFVLDVTTENTNYITNVETHCNVFEGKNGLDLVTFKPELGCTYVVNVVGVAMKPSLSISLLVLDEESVLRSVASYTYVKPTSNHLFKLNIGARVDPTRNNKEKYAVYKKDLGLHVDMDAINMRDFSVTLLSPDLDYTVNPTNNNGLRFQWNYDRLLLSAVDASDSTINSARFVIPFVTPKQPTPLSDIIAGEVRVAAVLKKWNNVNIDIKTTVSHPISVIAVKGTGEFTMTHGVYKPMGNEEGLNTVIGEGTDIINIIYKCSGSCTMKKFTLESDYADISLPEPSLNPPSLGVNDLLNSFTGDNDRLSNIPAPVGATCVRSSLGIECTITNTGSTSDFAVIPLTNTYSPSCFGSSVIISTLHKGSDPSENPSTVERLLYHRHNPYELVGKYVAGSARANDFSLLNFPLPVGIIPNSYMYLTLSSKSESEKEAPTRLVVPPSLLTVRTPTHSKDAEDDVHADGASIQSGFNDNYMIYWYKPFNRPIISIPASYLRSIPSTPSTSSVVTVTFRSSTDNDDANSLVASFDVKVLNGVVFDIVPTKIDPVSFENNEDQSVKNDSGIDLNVFSFSFPSHLLPVDGSLSISDITIDTSSPFSLSNLNCMGEATVPHYDSDSGVLTLSELDVNVGEGKCSFVIDNPLTIDGYHSKSKNGLYFTLSFLAKGEPDENDPDAPIKDVTIKQKIYVSYLPLSLTPLDNTIYVPTSKDKKTPILNTLTLRLPVFNNHAYFAFAITTDAPLTDVTVPNTVNCGKHNFPLTVTSPAEVSVPGQLAEPNRISVLLDAHVSNLATTSVFTLDCQVSVSVSTTSPLTVSDLSPAPGHVSSLTYTPTSTPLPAPSISLSYMDVPHIGVTNGISFTIVGRSYKKDTKMEFKFSQPIFKGSYTIYNNYAMVNFEEKTQQLTFTITKDLPLIGGGIKITSQLGVLHEAADKKAREITITAKIDGIESIFALPLPTASYFDVSLDPVESPEVSLTVNLNSKRAGYVVITDHVLDAAPRISTPTVVCEGHEVATQIFTHFIKYTVKLTNFKTTPCKVSFSVLSRLEKGGVSYQTYLEGTKPSSFNLLPAVVFPSLPFAFNSVTAVRVKEEDREKTKTKAGVYFFVSSTLLRHTDSFGLKISSLITAPKTNPVIEIADAATVTQLLPKLPQHLSNIQFGAPPKKAISLTVDNFSGWVKHIPYKNPEADFQFAAENLLVLYSPVNGLYLPKEKISKVQYTLDEDLKNVQECNFQHLHHNSISLSSSGVGIGVDLSMFSLALDLDFQSLQASDSASLTGAEKISLKISHDASVINSISHCSTGQLTVNSSNGDDVSSFTISDITATDKTINCWYTQSSVDPEKLDLLQTEAFDDESLDFHSETHFTHNSQLFTSRRILSFTVTIIPAFTSSVSLSSSLTSHISSSVFHSSPSPSTALYRLTTPTPSSASKIHSLLVPVLNTTADYHSLSVAPINSTVTLSDYFQDSDSETEALYTTFNISMNYLPSPSSQVSPNLYTDERVLNSITKTLQPIFTSSSSSPSLPSSVFSVILFTPSRTTPTHCLKGCGIGCLSLCDLKASCSVNEDCLSGTCAIKGMCVVPVPEDKPSKRLSPWIIVIIALVCLLILFFVARTVFKYVQAKRDREKKNNEMADRNMALLHIDQN